jgi:hypothetical protein
MKEGHLMLRVPLDKAHIRRTIRPLYGWSQATPKSCFLDPAWDRSVDIYPGMAMMRTSGENYSLLNGTGVPAGLSGLYVGGDGVDEVRDVGINVFAVWVLADDAEFEILAPAFDTSVSWVDPGNGTDVLVHAHTAGANRGKLVPAGTVGASGAPVARLIKVSSASKIIIGGLTPRT